MKRLLLTFITLSTFASPSFASNTNDQSAQKLKDAFQTMLDYQKTVNEAFGGVDLVYEGELTVTNEATYYTITFPRILIKALEAQTDEENEEQDKEIFDIGVITINAMPDEKDGYWKTVMTLPTELTLGQEEKTAFSMSFAEQRNIGLFSEHLGYFTKMDMNLSDIKFSMLGEDTGLSMGGLQLFMNIEENDQNRFSGPGHLSISNLVIAPPEDEETIKMEELKLDYSMQNALLPTLQEYQAKLLKHSETFKALQNLDPEDSQAAAANGKAIMDMFFDLYDFDIDGFAFKYSAKNITATSDKPNKEFSLGSGNLGFGFKGLSSEKGSLTINAEYAGIKSAKMEKDLKQALPSNGKLDINAINIPYEALSQIIGSTATSVAQDPSTAQMAAMGIMMRLPAVLAQAETKIIMENNGIKNEIYDLNINGDVSTDLTSIIGFGANFKAVFEGLDTLISAMQSDTSEDNEGRLKFIEALGKWQSIGTQTTGPNGKPAYSFDIETTPAGQVMINGQDASAVLQ